jgi:redox-sensitive bicupin YhaK (pirin superfamily)
MDSQALGFRALPCAVDYTRRWKKHAAPPFTGSGKHSTPERPVTTRKLQNVIHSVAASDGAGVKLKRSVGNRQGVRVDPFLMLDEFFSDDPKDYLAGFPSHPHRGFETVTYMLDGHMLHEDHLGNRGDLTPGAVQWMTAGRGIVHSEMPQQQAGRMRGFQLWINLPSKEKMQPASYRDIPPADIPTASLPEGVQVKVIAGAVDSAGVRTEGPIQGRSTEPVYLDVALPAGAQFRYSLPQSHNAFIYPYEGSLVVGSAAERKPLAQGDAGVLSAGTEIEIAADAKASRFLLLAGKPIGEPVVQYGPFVMNTSQEIEQAITDFQSGRFATA